MQQIVIFVQKKSGAGGMGGWIGGNAGLRIANSNQKDVLPVKTPVILISSSDTKNPTFLM